MGNCATATMEQIWLRLHEIADPEIPVISITDLGIVREVSLSGQQQEVCTVTITPTYSGCPATDMIATAIRDQLTSCGFATVNLRVQLSPPWTTDWLTEAGRAQLTLFGISPPAHRAQELVHIAIPSPTIPVQCPICGSAETELLSQFSSTPCKALYRCKECREPFDYFKVH